MEVQLDVLQKAKVVQRVVNDGRPNGNTVVKKMAGFARQIYGKGMKQTQCRWLYV